MKKILHTIYSDFITYKVKGGSNIEENDLLRRIT